MEKNVEKKMEAVADEAEREYAKLLYKDSTELARRVLKEKVKVA